MSVFKQKQSAQEDEKVGRLVPTRKERTWKDIAKTAAMVILSPLAIVGLLSGCGPVPETKTERKQEEIKELAWFPTFLLEKENNSFKIKDVSLGVPASDWKTFPGSYVSTKDIPPEIRDAYRKDLEEIVIPTILEKFNITDPDVIAILENNVFLIFSTGAGSNIPSGYHHGDVYSIVDVEGHKIAVCPQSYCTEYNIVKYKKEELIPGNEVFALRTIVHELLHDVFSTGLSETEQTEFVDALKQFLENFELDEESLRKMIELRRTQYSVMAGEVDEYLVSEEGDMIDIMRKFRVDFIREKYPELSREQRRRLESAIFAIENFQVDVSNLTLGPTSTLSEYRDRYAELGISPDYYRETFLIHEGYSYLIELDMIPENLLRFYEPYMQKTFLSQRKTNYPFSSWKELEEYLPLFNEFISYAISRYENGDF
ncbi:hypothetical protein J4450_00230 [Candidatus Micrarchaeota archaeon]|nr:hypothetical protein [Candidatus Micrarchaeota archaeon]